MWLGGAKIYFDGSHYIAIPHTERPSMKRKKPVEELVTVESEEDVENEVLNVVENDTQIQIEEVLEEVSKTILEPEEKPKKMKTISLKDYFDELYTKHIDLTKSERKKKIKEEMQQFFASEELVDEFVNINFDRKIRNLICKRVRMSRKANLANFNYFCTFTYDNQLHTEESFKRKLKTCFRHLCERKNWKYMGVWERGTKSNRLHFHGLFYIPEKSMPGMLIEVNDYDTRNKVMRKTVQSIYFNERFGRSDFKEILPEEKMLGSALAYLMKYIEKTGEKIVYSKNLPQYFISDIIEDDIVCTIGQEDKKLLLFDDFMCLDEGVVIGRVSPEVIEQMKKAN